MWSIGRTEHEKSEEEYEEIDYDPEYDQAPQGDHSQAENDHKSTEDDHESTEDDHESTEDDHENTEDDHESTEDDPGLSRQTSLQFSFVYFHFFFLIYDLNLFCCIRGVSSYLKSQSILQWIDMY